MKDPRLRAAMRISGTPTVLIALWLVGILLLGCAIPTFALNSSSAEGTSVTYATLSGSSAFKVNKAFVNLGDLVTGEGISSRVVLTVTNNTGRRRIENLQVEFIQDEPVLIPSYVVSISPTSLRANQKANVTFSGTVGSTAGDISGYFLITGFDGFLTLAIPVFGAVTDPAALAPPMLLPPAEAVTDPGLPGTQPDSGAPEGPADVLQPEVPLDMSAPETPTMVFSPEAQAQPSDLPPESEPPHPTAGSEGS